MKTSHDVSRDAYTLPILLVLEMATEWNVRLRRGGDPSFHFNPVCRRSSPNPEEAIHAAGEQVNDRTHLKCDLGYLQYAALTALWLSSKSSVPFS